MAGGTSDWARSAAQNASAGALAQTRRTQYEAASESTRAMLIAWHAAVDTSVASSADRRASGGIR
jgi:hypothetical protein